MNPTYSRTKVSRTSLDKFEDMKSKIDHHCRKKLVKIKILDRLPLRRLVIGCELL